LHSDNVGWPRYLELEVGISGDGHEIYVTWLPQDDMIGPREVDHLIGEHLGAVVACVTEGLRQSILPEGDELLARDHSIEWVWALFELELSQPQPFKGV
jgi:hypothetical protein